MGRKIRLGIFIILMVLCISNALAATIGVSPSIIRYNRMMKEGYAETPITVSTSIVEDVSAHITFEGEIASWMSADPKGPAFTFSRDKPYSFTLVMEPPADAKNGNYTGQVKLTTDELATVDSGAGSSVLAQVALLIYVEVIGDEIIACRAGAISTSNAEVGDPINFRAIVYNDGNVRLRPRVSIRVLDQYQTQTLFTSNFFGSQILPTKEKEILKEVEGELPIGQYFADITLEDCGVSKKTTFDIVEKGQISDSGEIIGIRTNEIAQTDELIPIVPIFRNHGARKVLAQFKGEIRDLKTDKIVQPLESEQVEVDPGGTLEFRMFFTPTRPGDYQISGRVLYNKKLTFEERSQVIKVVGDEKGLGWVFFLMVYIAIGFVILILIAKIRKARKQKRN